MTVANDVLSRETWRREFVLVAMGYKDQKTGNDLRPEVFALITEVCELEFNIACIRADHVPKPGEDLRHKLHELINRAALVVAEISEMRPNVFYEFGYAAARNKAPVPLLDTATSADPPYDIRGLEAVEYVNTPEGREVLRGRLVDIFRARLTKGPPLLRDMLMPVRPHPSYVVTSPKYPKPETQVPGQPRDRRTFGDYLGVVGIISAFGSFYGDIKGVELISAEHADPMLHNWDVNLYLIGSEKVNQFSGQLMRSLCKAPGTRWTFDVKPVTPEWTYGKTGDWPVGLFRDGVEIKGELGEDPLSTEGPKKMIWLSDYGIVVRGPHPKYPSRLAILMAGPHTLGTAAACLAATRPEYIEQIKAKLPADLVEDKGSTFWALVMGKASPADSLIDEDGVEIIEAGVYPRR